jgi:hypothetical protein
MRKQKVSNYLNMLRYLSSFDVKDTKAKGGKEAETIRRREKIWCWKCFRGACWNNKNEMQANLF